MTAAPLPDGFVAHDGGKMPIAAGINVTVLDRGGDQIGPLQSGWFVWEWDSSLLDRTDHIIAYRKEPENG